MIAKLVASQKKIDRKNTLINDMEQATLTPTIRSHGIYEVEMLASYSSTLIFGNVKHAKSVSKGGQYNSTTT